MYKHCIVVEALKCRDAAIEREELGFASAEVYSFQSQGAVPPFGMGQVMWIHPGLFGLVSNLYYSKHYLVKTSIVFGPVCPEFRQLSEHSAELVLKAIPSFKNLVGEHSLIPVNS